MLISKRELSGFTEASLERVLCEKVDKNELRALYLEVLVPLRGEDPLEKRPLKREMGEAVMEMDEALMAAFFEAIDPTYRTMLELLVWTGDMKLNELESRLGFDISATRGTTDSFGREVQALFFRKHFPMILFVEEYRGGYWHANVKSLWQVVLPPAVRSFFRERMPKPEGYHIERVSVPPADSLRYQNGDFVAEDLRVVADYIQQGHLQYTKSKVVTKKCIRAVASLLSGPEFFPAEKSSSKLPLLRAELLVNMVALVGDDLREALLQTEPDAEQLLRIFPKEVFKKGLWAHEHVLTHIRPLGEARQYDGKVMKRLWKLFSNLDEQEWLLLDNLEKYIRYRDLDLDIMKYERLFVKVDRASRGYAYDSSILIDGNNVLELMELPLVQGMLFVLATIGLVELDYTLPPRHALWQRPNEAFLTPFDGVKAARLTPLGSYAFGQCDEVEIKVRERAQVELVLNPHRLTATCRNIDPVTEMTLLEYMEKVSSGCYRLTRKHLIKGCVEERDIERRVEQFRAFLPVEFPPLWEAFLDEFVDSALALRKEGAYSVYKLSDSPELRTLFLEDALLREKSVKVEGLRVAIKQSDQAVVARRLKKLGFMMK